MSSCPHCKNRITQVRDTRPYTLKGEVLVRRKRLCLDCKRRFTTFELHEKTYKKCEHLLGVEIVKNLAPIRRAHKILEGFLKQEGE